MYITTIRIVFHIIFKPYLWKLLSYTYKKNQFHQTKLQKYFFLNISIRKCVSFKKPFTFCICMAFIICVHDKTEQLTTDSCIKSFDSKHLSNLQLHISMFIYIAIRYPPRNGLFQIHSITSPSTLKRTSNIREIITLS